MTLRLLVVDDSALIRQRLLEMLEGIVGIETRASAATLDEALLCARRDLSTFVLLDLNFPEGNALSIIPTLKRLPSTPQIAVLTNDARASTRRQCLQAGADWFFDKSTEFQIAIELVHTQAALN
jgi:two-component system OmpR family response regulator